MKQYKRPFLIALTGGIASGKSIVSHWFEEKGYKVIYADTISHFLLEKEEIKQKIREKFGNGVFNINKVNRKKLGKIVFNSPEKLAFLNTLLHPLVRIKIQRIIDEEDSKILIIEIPLLFESRLEKCFDLILNVFSEEAIQVKRLITRNDISEQEALKKIHNQLPGVEKCNKADINIINNTSKEYLFKQLYEIEEKFLKLEFRDIQRFTNH